MEITHMVTIVITSLVVMTTCRFESYDREEEAGTVAHIIKWMNAICKAEHDPIPKMDWRTFNTHLKDGVMLCVLINKLLKANGKSPVHFTKRTMSTFIEKTNIENFIKGCVVYGMEKGLSLQTGDLMELNKDRFLNVIHYLHNLGLIANSKDYQPKYTREILNTTDMNYFK